MNELDKTELEILLKLLTRFYKEHKTKINYMRFDKCIPKLLKDIESNINVFIWIN